MTAPLSTATAPLAFSWLRSTTAGKTWQTATVTGQQLTMGETGRAPMMTFGGSLLHLLGFPAGRVASGTSSAGGLTITFSRTPLPLLTARGIPDPCGCGNLASPLGISFANAIDGMIVSEPQPGLSAVLTTHDGGQSWQVATQVVSPNPTSYVSFVTSSLGFGLGSGLDPNAVLQTVNGGQTWSKVGDLPSAPGTGGNASLAFVSAQKGFAVTVNGLVETLDGGKTWSSVSTLASSLQVWGVAFASPAVGCVDTLGGNGKPWATADGGATWTAVASTFYSHYNYSPIACAAALVNLAFGTGLPPPPSSGQTMVAAPGNQTAVVFAQGGLPGVSSPAGELWTARVGDHGWRIQSLPAGQFDACGCSVDFLSPSQGFVIGLYGRLFETTDGGRTWVQLP